MLAFLVILLLVGSLLAWASEGWGTRWPRLVSLGVLGLGLAAAASCWGHPNTRVALSPPGVWIAEFHAPWIPRFGISLHLAMDGLSLVLVLLAFGLGLAATAASWTEIRHRVGFFHFNLLLTLAGVVGVFLAMDLFLFFVFWEIMLVPMYLLINIWGHERRTHAAVKFFLFTQAGGLLMLVSILALGIAHVRTTGEASFDYFALLGTSLPAGTEVWIMLGFLAAFAVKLPAVPFHTWLPDAHTEAPTGGSVILAGLLLKTGAYGLLRFAIPLFPAASRAAAFWMMLLGLVGILYGAFLAFAQTDFKRLVAYSSIAHLGFVLLGIYAWNLQARQGAVMTMVAHGLSTGALFIVAGSLQERLRTRDMRRMGGLWRVAPRLGGIALFFAMASLGLPGLANFIGEFLVLFGAYRQAVPLAVIGALGVVTAAIYALALIQRTFHGPNTEGWRVPDLSSGQLATLATMMLVVLWLGLYPQPVLTMTRPVLDGLEAQTADAPSRTAATLPPLSPGGGEG